MFSTFIAGNCSFMSIKKMELGQLPVLNQVTLGKNVFQSIETVYTICCTSFLIYFILIDISPTFITAIQSINASVVIVQYSVSFTPNNFIIHLDSDILIYQVNQTKDDVKLHKQ